MKAMVWRWKANAENFLGKPGVFSVFINPSVDEDYCTVGRDGWVCFIEDII